MKKKVNYEKSLDYYNKVKDYIEIKQGQCYNNVANLITYVLTNEKFKIAYCYVGCEPFPMVRHCIVLDEEEDAIDISLIKTHENKDILFENWEYNIFKIFEVDEYVKSIEENDLRCNLPDCKEEYEWFIKNKLENPIIQVSEYDYDNYIFPMLRKDKDRDKIEKQIMNRFNELFKET